MRTLGVVGVVGVACGRVAQPPSAMADRTTGVSDRRMAPALPISRPDDATLPPRQRLSSRSMQAFSLLAKLIVFLGVAIGAAMVVVPRMLDRVYFTGTAPASHYDGQRFFNPGGGEDLTSPPGGGSRIGFLWRFLTGNDGRPSWPAHVAVVTDTPPAHVPGDALRVTWVGHATMLVQTQGLNILTDPVWSDTAGPFGFGPRRVTAPGIAFDALPKIDAVLLSHNHYDHLDLATLKRLWARDRPMIVTSLGNDAILRGAGIASQARDWGERVAIRPGIDVVVTRNEHWSSRWGADRNRALWSSFVVTLPGGNLFFAGDTGMGDGGWIDEARALGPIRLALVPIGAFRFAEGQMAIGSHVGPVDAAEIAARLGARHALAIHWGTFRLSWEGYDTPRQLLAVVNACRGEQVLQTVEIGRPTMIGRDDGGAARSQDRDAVLRCLDTPAARALR